MGIVDPIQGTVGSARKTPECIPSTHTAMDVCLRPTHF